MKRTKTQYKPFLARRYEKRSRNKFIFTLIIIAFLLYSLLAWILPTLIGGLSFFNKFKHNPKPPTPVSEDITIAPPVLNIPFEATNTAQIKIKGYAQPHSKIEVYIDDDLKTTATTDENGSFTSGNIPLNLGTNNIYGKTVNDKGDKSLSSKPITITFINEKPKLEVSSPQDNQVIKGGDKKVTVSGSTDTSGDITVTVNGSQAIVDESGNFSQTIAVNDGDNNIVIAAADQAGNSTQISRRVTYQSS